MPTGTGRRVHFSGVPGSVSTSPPSSEAAALSACASPLAAPSPSSAYPSSAPGSSASPQSASAATTAATAEAAEPPMPEPSGMPLCKDTSRPSRTPWSAAMRSKGRVAEFASGSRGRSIGKPLSSPISTPGRARRRKRTISPAASIE